MLLSLLSVAGRGKNTPAAVVAESYEERLRGYCQLQVERHPSEARLLESSSGQSGRTRPVLVLLDSRGKLFSSTELATWIGRQRDGGVQHLIFAIGPADGWSEAARGRADLLLSFGPMTFPHELARVMLAEQVYRAFTILAGHPYHSGH